LNLAEASNVDAQRNSIEYITTMKKILITFAIASAALSAFAQQSAQTAPEPATTAKHATGGQHMIDRLLSINTDIISQLKLTPDQQKQSDDLLAATKTKIQDLASQLKADKADKDTARTKVRQLMKDYTKSLTAILTKDQKKQYETLVKAARAKAKAARDGAGKPNG
jgi:Spy/CpxP family protein refolding chaperone